jgi:hypothetical protein
MGTELQVRHTDHLAADDRHMALPLLYLPFCQGAHW